MNRFITPDAGPTGFAAWLAGYGQRQNQVHDIEAGQRAQANQQLYGAIGQGIGNAATTFVNRRNQLADAATAHAYQLENYAAQGANQQAVQNNVYQRQMDLENQHAENDMLEKVYAGFLTPNSSARQQGGMAGGTMAQGIGTNMDGSVMMPDQPNQSQEGTVPLPSVDPAMTPQYRKAQEQYETIRNRAIEAYSDPNMSRRDKIALGLSLQPVYRQAEFMMKAQPRQQPPTMQEQVQTATYTDPNTGVIYHPKDIAVTNGPKSQTEAPPPAWSQLPPGPEREAAKLEDLNAHRAIIDGNEYLWDDKQRRWEKQKEDSKGGEGEKSIDKRLAKATAEAEKNRAANLKAEADAQKALDADPSNPDLKAVADMAGFAKLQTDPIEIMKDMKANEHRAMIAEFSPRTITMEEYTALGKQILSEWGNDPNMVPEELKNDLRKLGWKLRGESPP